MTKPSKRTTVSIPRCPLIGPVTGTAYRHARVLGLIDRTPTANEQAWLDAVREVQADYADLIPLSPRAYAYRVSGKPGFTKKISVAGMTDFLTLARRAGWIEWDSVDDSRTRTINVPSDLSPEALDKRLRAVARHWRRWRRLGQRYVPEVWVEAVGSMRSVEDPAYEFGAAIVSSGGTNSLTEIGRLVERAWERWIDLDMITVVLLIGDYDRKGRERYDRAIAEAWRLLQDRHLTWMEPDDPHRLRYAKGVIRFEWVAVTAAQIADPEWALESSDDDEHLPRVERNFEVEACDPAMLRDHLRDRLRAYTSTRLLNRVVEASRLEAKARLDALGELDATAPPWRWTDSA